jgi:hypothetical protein
METQFMVIEVVTDDPAHLQFVLDILKEMAYDGFGCPHMSGVCFMRTSLPPLEVDSWVRSRFPSFAGRLRIHLLPEVPLPPAPNQHGGSHDRP